MDTMEVLNKLQKTVDRSELAVWEIKNKIQRLVHLEQQRKVREEIKEKAVRIEHDRGIMKFNEELRYVVLAETCRNMKYNKINDRILSEKDFRSEATLLVRSEYEV